MESALVGERADDLARLDLVALADGDPVGGHRLAVGAARPALAVLVAVVAVGTLAAGRALGLRLEQQRGLALEDDGESRGHVDLGHVVLAHVVADDVAEERHALGVAERLGDAVVETGEPRRVDVVDGRQLHLHERGAVVLLDRAQEVALAGRDERDRVAAAARTTGASDPVHVGLRVGGDVVVDDVADALDVEAAGGDVGRDEDVELGVLELADRALAHLLGHVAVDRRRGEAAGPQLLGQRLGLVLRADEDDHPLEVLDLEDAGEGVDLLRVGDREVALGDVRGGRGPVLDRDLVGLLEVLLRDPADLRRHGRREQRDLLVLGRVGEDGLDVLGEAHVEHLVGLVEHEEAELGEVEGPLLEVVHDPARGADDDVDTAAQRAQLHAVALAAVDGEHLHAGHVRGVPLERLAHLERELAGGGEDEGLRRLLPQVEAREDRQREGRGLAGAGLGEADDVAALEQRRDRRGLDRRRRLVADVTERVEHTVVETQLVEGGQGLRLVLRLVVRGVRHGVNGRASGRSRGIPRRAGLGCWTWIDRPTT